MRLSDFSVDRPVTISMMVLIVVVVGLMSLSRLGLDLMPKLDFPTLSVVTRYDGASSEDIEQALTRPLEGAVASVNRVSKIKSISQEDSSILLIEFEWGTDLDAAAQDLREAIAMVEPFLPEEAGDPMVVKFSLSAMPVLGYGVSGLDGDPITLKSFLDDNVVPRLERLDGVAQVLVMGGPTREVVVDLDRSRLDAAGLPANQVAQMLMMQSLDLPAGRLLEGGEEFLLRTLGAYDSLDEMRGAAVGAGPTGTPILLSDVADVHMGVKDVRNITRTNGSRSLIMMINKQSGANPLQVSRRIKGELKAIKAELGDQIQLNLLMDTGVQIQAMATNVTQTGLVGGLLAILFMWFFLRSGRPTFAIAMAIPLSLLVTFIPIYVTGETLNLMTMGGLMLGIGMLVDNAVVVIENVFRHLEEGEDRIQAAKQGSAEVGLAIMASTLTTLAVFLAMFFGGGLAGQLVRGLAMVVAFALAASLMVALTIVPMLASVLFNRNTATHGGAHSWFEPLRDGYARLLRAALERRWLSLVVVTVLVIAAAGVTPFLGAEFLPAADQPLIIGKVKFPVGTPLSYTASAAERIEQAAMAVPGILTVGLSVGVNEDDMGAGLSDMSPAGVHEAQLFLRLKKDRSVSQQEVIAQLREVSPQIDGMSLEWMDMAAAMMGGGGAKPVQVLLFGDDLDDLRRIGNDMLEAMDGVEGLKELDLSLKVAKPERHLRVDREAARSFGLGIAQIARAVETASLGRVVGLYRDGSEEYAIRVRYGQQDRSSVDSLDRILVPLQLGGAVRLSQVAHFEEGFGSMRIDREDQSRRITVAGNLDGRDLGSVIADVKAATAGIRAAMPPGYTTEIGGTYEQMMDAFKTLAAALALALLLVYMVMASQFEAFLQPLVIMVTVPLALVGVVAGLLVTGKPMSVVTFVGVIMLAGIVVNNGIVLIDYINQLRKQGMDRREAVIAGGATRLRAVLITSGTTITGLMPMALFPGRGAELTGDMAVTVAGGLAASTLLTLLVVPIVYELMDSVGQWFGQRLQRIFHADEPAPTPTEQLS